MLKRAGRALGKMVKAAAPYGVLWLYRTAREKVKKERAWRAPFCAAAALPSLSAPPPAGSPRFIVTLTSYGRRAGGKAPWAVRSLFDQTVPPDKIVLYLAHGTQVPSRLKILQKSGLEIRFCEDSGPYKKLIPALQDFPDDVLVTADDDVLYFPRWFELLKETHLRNPGKICCYRAHEICLDEERNVVPYLQWRLDVQTIEHVKRLFPTGCGGVLYPPRSFGGEVLDAAKFRALSPTADDVWFWATARHNGKEYALVKDRGGRLGGVWMMNDRGLWKINLGENKNDEYIQNVLKAYPDVYESIL